MKNRALIIIFAVLLALSVACQKTEEPEVSAAPTEDTDPTDTGAVETPSPTPYDGPVNPLTGLPVDAEIASDRPIAVMLNNLKEALPQQGVAEADIIYEALAEGGITRMLAVFQDVSGVGIIGSVRSVRPYYLDLALGLDAILMHAGGSNQAYVDIAALGVDNLDGVNGLADIFYRDAQRMARAGSEHSMMTTSELIAEYLPTYNMRVAHEDGYAYQADFAEDGTPAGGMDAATVEVVFSTYKTGVFSYDDGSGLYMISEYGAPYVDGNTEAQVGVTNVLVLFANITSVPGDTEGRLQAQLTGEGDGYFICGGAYIPIRWSKASVSAQFFYTTEDGTPVVFGMGTSYVNVVPIGTTVTIQ